MPISSELVIDLLRLAGEKGLLTAEDIEVVNMQSDSRPDCLHGILSDLTVKLILRIRALAGDKPPPDGPPILVGELWRWYVENGGIMSLGDLENPEGFVE